MTRSAKGASWRFLVNGALSNAALYGLFALLLYWEVDYRIAVTVSYVLGVLWNYTVNRLWSWRSQANVASSFAKFVAMNVAVYFAHLGLVVLLVEGLGISAYLAPLLSMALLLVPQFVTLHRFIFR